MSCINSAPQLVAWLSTLARCAVSFSASPVLAQVSIDAWGAKNLVTEERVRKSVSHSIATYRRSRGRVTRKTELLHLPQLGRGNICN